MPGFADLTAISESSAEKMKKHPVFSVPQFFLDVYCLQAGQQQQPHTHDGQAKLYYVLEGSGEFLVGDVRRVAAAGTAVLAESGEIHGVRNPGPDLLRLLVVMAPNPNRG